MPLRFRLFSVLLVSASGSLTIGARVLLAQVPAPTVVVAGGLEAHSFDGGGFSPTYAGELGLQWRLTSGWAVRVSVTGILNNRTLATAACGPAQCTDPSGFSTSRMTAVGGEALAIRHLIQRGVRVSLLGGLGIYQTRFRQTSYFETAGRWATIADRQLTPALSGGLGVAVPMGPVTPFVEVRALIFAHGAGTTNLIPLQLGIQF